MNRNKDSWFSRYANFDIFLISTYIKVIYWVGAVVLTLAPFCIMGLITLPLLSSSGSGDRYRHSENGSSILVALASLAACFLLWAIIMVIWRFICEMLIVVFKIEENTRSTSYSAENRLSSNISTNVVDDEYDYQKDIGSVDSTYEQNMEAARLLLNQAEESDAASDWIKTIMLSTKALANKESTEARSLISRARARRDLALAKEAESRGDVGEAIRLVWQASKYNSIPNLSEYLNRLEKKLPVKGSTSQINEDTESVTNQADESTDSQITVDESNDNFSQTDAMNIDSSDKAISSSGFPDLISGGSSVDNNYLIDLEEQLRNRNKTPIESIVRMARNLGIEPVKHEKGIVRSKTIDRIIEALRKSSGPFHAL